MSESRQLEKALKESVSTLTGNEIATSNELFEWFSNIAAKAEKSAPQKNPITLTTHIIKGVHPSAVGSNVFHKPENHGITIVDSNTLSEGGKWDVTGNAANKLKEFQILQHQFLGKPLIKLFEKRSSLLKDALSASESDFDLMAEAFASLKRKPTTTSPSVKQIYFLVGDDPREDEDFHLLAPLYATSLAHYVFRTINEDRFGDPAKAARQAKRNKQPFEHGYNDYPNLCVQKLGGTKPQNISQLNSERGGQNYLLASLPPIWHSASVKPPLNTDSAFNRFATRPDVRYLLDRLSHFLSSDPPPNKETRNYRDSLVEAITAELLNFAAELRSLPAGWSQKPECQLNESETLWLDPGRAEMDEPFRQQWQNTDWPRTVCNRFANWLNAHLSKGLPVGDSEQKQWSTDASKSEHWLRQIDDDGRWINAIEELEEELAE